MTELMRDPGPAVQPPSVARRALGAIVLLVVCAIVFAALYFLPAIVNAALDAALGPSSYDRGLGIVGIAVFVFIGLRLAVTR